MGILSNLTLSLSLGHTSQIPKIDRMYTRAKKSLRYRMATASLFGRVGIRLRRLCELALYTRKNMNRPAKLPVKVWLTLPSCQPSRSKRRKHYIVPLSLVIMAPEPLFPGILKKKRYPQMMKIEKLMAWGCTCPHHPPTHPSPRAKKVAKDRAPSFRSPLKSFPWKVPPWIHYASHFQHQPPNGYDGTNLPRLPVPFFYTTRVKYF